MSVPVSTKGDAHRINRYNGAPAHQAAIRIRMHFPTPTGTSRRISWRNSDSARRKSEIGAEGEIKNSDPRMDGILGIARRRRWGSIWVEGFAIRRKSDETVIWVNGRIGKKSIVRKYHFGPSNFSLGSTNYKKGLFSI